MTKAEALKLIYILKLDYPVQFKGLSNTDYDILAAHWVEQFQGYAYQQVYHALNGAISAKTDGFPPSIGEIKAMLRTMTEPERMTAQDAWSIVMKAVRRGAYHAAEDWDKMPPEVQRCITPERIRDMAIDENFNESVEQSLFTRTWNTHAERRRVEAAVPPPVRQAMLQAETRVDRIGAGRET